MQSKMKPCSGVDCNGELRQIWGNLNGQKFCKNCFIKVKGTQPKVKVQKPIAKHSDKRAKQEAAYKVLRTVYLKTHSNCVANLSGCMLKGTDIHHLHWGANRNEFMNDFSSVVLVCRNCHTKIHSELSDKEAKELGLKL